MAQYRPKIPKPQCGHEDGKLDLPDFVIAYETYANATEQWQILNMPANHNWAADTAANRRKDSLALGDLRTAISDDMMLEPMGFHHGSDLWRAIVEVMGMYLIHLLKCFVGCVCVHTVTTYMYWPHVVFLVVQERHLMHMTI